jgi:hypothetical protein
MSVALKIILTLVMLVPSCVAYGQGTHTFSMPDSTLFFCLVGKICGCLRNR